MNPLRAVAGTPGALYLLGVSLVGRLPTAMAALAIVQLVHGGNGGYLSAGLTTSVYVLTGAVGQPLLSRRIDRMSRMLVLLVSGALGTAGFCALALTADRSPLLGLLSAAIAGLFTPPLEPSLRSLWPGMMGDGRKLQAAFSLDAGAQEIMFILGPLLTVVGIAAFGATGNVFFMAAIGLGGTVAFAVHGITRSPVVDAERTRSGRTPLHSASFRRLVLFVIGLGVPLGALTIVATVSGDRHAAAGLAGWTLAANALGALIGALLTAVRPLTRPAARVLAGCGLLFALGYLPMMLVDAPAPVWLLVALLSGLMLPPTLTQVFSRVAELSDPDSLTEANAWVVSAMSLGIALGTLGAGAVAGQGAGIPLVVIGGSAVAALLSLVVLPPRRSGDAESSGRLSLRGE